jgi:hypothetical protein
MCRERDPSVGVSLLAIQCAALAKMVSPAFSKDGDDTLLPARSEVWEGACSRQGRHIQLMLLRADSRIASKLPPTVSIARAKAQ